MGQHQKSIEKQLEGLRAKGAKDSNAELLNLRREQFALRLQRATGQSPKPDQFGKVRKNIARLKTVQRAAAREEDGREGMNSPAAETATEKSQRTLTGKVVSAKTAKTIAVEIERVLKHPRYGKYIRRTTRLLAHDEAGDAKEGDTVTIAACRPMSQAARTTASWP